MNSPISYLGGKSRLAERIVNEIPADHTCYCEPFCGAAWVFFRKEPSKSEILNDADGELVNFWRVIQYHLPEFMRLYEWILISREHFDTENKRDPNTMTDVQRAVRYYYLQKMGFGGKTYKRTFGMSASSAPRLNLGSMDRILLEVKYRLEKVVLEHLDACDCIQRYDRPGTFFYIDPPYYATAGYAIAFGPDDYIRLAKTLASIKGRCLISLNDHPEVRSVFSGFKIATVSTTYSVGNPRTAKDSSRPSVKEVLIKNY